MESASKTYRRLWKGRETEMPFKQFLEIYNNDKTRFHNFSNGDWVDPSLDNQDEQQPQPPAVIQQPVPPVKYSIAAKKKNGSGLLYAGLGAMSGVVLVLLIMKNKK